MKNEMRMILDAKSENESLVRICVVSFLGNMDPTVEEMEDVKTAVSEAITNAIIHGQPKDEKVYIHCLSEDDLFHVEIEDYGIGIEDVKKAMEPLYTTKPEQERSGMGFAFMEAFMDELNVESTVGKGTKVSMMKRISHGRNEN